MKDSDWYVMRLEKYIAKITELEQKLKMAQNIALEMGLKYNEQNKKLTKLEKDNEAMEKLLAGKTIVCKSTNVAKRLV